MKKKNLNILKFLFSLVNQQRRSVEAIPTTKVLSPTAAAIKYYKDTFQLALKFSKVPTTEDYHMLDINLVRSKRMQRK